MTNPPSPVPMPQAPVKKGGSGKWLIFGGAGCLIMVLMSACIITGVLIWYVHSTSLPNKYVNTADKLSANLKEKFIPFSFSYPDGWSVQEDGSKPDDDNFIDLEKTLKDGEKKYTVEKFAVGAGSSSGSLEGDMGAFPLVAAELSATLARGFPDYVKVGEGATTVNGYKAYELLFSTKSDAPGESVKGFGRVIFISGANVGEKNGVMLFMFATDRQSAITKPSELGVEGETGKILPTFKLGK